MINQWSFYTAKELRPTGWLRRQLEIQAEGLSGHLDLIWPDVRDSAWIGGNREGWERVPYWLDGFIPLAWLLDRDDLKERAKRYVDAVIARQCPSGWICPCPEDAMEKYDVWALFLVCKTLTVYADCTGDPRIDGVIRRAMHHFYDALCEGKVRLFNWGAYRWFEAFVSLIWLQQRQPEDWIPELGRMLREKGIDYESFYKLWENPPMTQWRYDTHIVNIMMALKAEAVCCKLLGGQPTNQAETMRALLDHFHGTATGMFSGDENLGGTSPIHGTELCAVVEQMYSYEWLLAATGESIWGDRLEQVALNALPAAISEDMWTHQYDQLPNQIACIPESGRSHFTTNSGQAHLFGLEPHFGCCTANFNQGWPKLALSVFLRGEREIVSALLLPAELHTQVENVPVCISQQTDYPFEHCVKITVSTEAPVEFTLRVRIPGWAKSLTVNDAPAEANGFYPITRVWEGTQTITIRFTAQPAFVKRPSGMRTLTYGPLLFSLPIRARWDRREYTDRGVTRKFPYCDYSLTPQSDWAYAFTDENVELQFHGVGSTPFSGSYPALTAEVTLRPIAWGMEPGQTDVCRATPEDITPTGDAVTLRLLPYGCTKLRMTELPCLGQTEPLRQYPPIA